MPRRHASTALTAIAFILISCAKSPLRTTPSTKALPDSNLAFIESPIVTPTPVTKTLPWCPDGERHLIWKMPGENNTVYLMGSIHMGKPEFYPLPDKVENAFANSPTFVVEVNTSSTSVKKAMGLLMKDGILHGDTTLKDLISAPVYNKVKSSFDDMGLPFARFAKFRPWLLAVTFTVLNIQSMGYVSEYGVENYLLGKAKDKKILELETVESQMALLKTLDGEAFLAYTVLSSEALKTTAKSVVKAWKCGNEELLELLLLKDYSEALPGFEEFTTNFFTKRNMAMAEDIEKLLRKKEDHFVVVGAAHLIGDYGIVQLLEQKGHAPTKL